MARTCPLYALNRILECDFVNNLTVHNMRPSLKNNPQQIEPHARHSQSYLWKIKSTDNMISLVFTILVAAYMTFEIDKKNKIIKIKKNLLYKVVPLQWTKTAKQVNECLLHNIDQDQLFMAWKTTSHDNSSVLHDENRWNLEWTRKRKDWLYLNKLIWSNQLSIWIMHVGYSFP